jgi:hypothetical protein
VICRLADGGTRLCTDTFIRTHRRLDRTTPPAPPLPTTIQEPSNTTQLTPACPCYPVSHHRPTTTPHASTQPAMSLSTMAASPALPHPGPPSTALKRRHTLPEPSERPQVLSYLPCSPQNTQKRAVLSLTTSHTPAMSPTTLSRPVDTPHSLSTPPSPPIHPSSPQLDPKQAVSPPPTHFDWAEDAAMLPTALSSHPRDLSGLKTGCTQPFRTLQ